MVRIKASKHLWYLALFDDIICSLEHADGGGGDQAYSRLSTTHGHITDCKLDSVVYAGVCVVI